MIETKQTESQPADIIFDEEILVGTHQKNSLSLEKLNAKQRCVIKINLRALVPGQLTIQTDFKYLQKVQSLLVNSIIDPIIDVPLVAPICMISHATTSVRLALAAT